jgi:hypothetical protein
MMLRLRYRMPSPYGGSVEGGTWTPRALERR